MSENLNDIRSDYYLIGTFGGQARYVRYDLNAFAEMERIYGSMEEANTALTRGSMTDVRRILWLGLIHDQAVLDEITGEPIRYKLSAYEVGKWITPNNMREIMQKLNEAISASVPAEEGTTNNTAPAQAHMQALNEQSTVVPLKNPN